MDDYLSSFSTVDRGVYVTKQLITLLSKGGFKLKKWISNCKEILRELPTEDVSPKIIDLDLEQLPIERALGVMWDSESDVLRVKAVTKNVANTKRGILSFVSSVFDPIGIVTPSILEPKLIIQELWKRKIDWDSKIPNDLNSRWQSWLENLKYIDSIEIPRWYGYSELNESKCEIHVFADASSTSYGAVAYLRIISSDTLHCSFLVGKSRLAPIKTKTLTVPKLELQAAVLSSRMKVSLIEELNVDIYKVYMYSDSKAILFDICNDNRQFDTYTMHRLNEIRSNTDISSWHYIPSSLNVADDLTRYYQFNKLVNNDRWLYGPSYLKTQNSEWPKEIVQAIDLKNLKQSSKSSNNSQCNHFSRNMQPFINWSYYSSWRKLVRHIAILLQLKSRWVNKKRKCRTGEKILCINTDVLNKSMLTIYKIVQKEHYTAEFELLSKNKEIPKTSSIFNLHPTIKDELLVVNSRLKTSFTITHSKNQIILPKDHPVSKLIIQDIHETNLHSGREFTLSQLRQSYWIPRVKGVLRRVIHQCLYCKRQRVKPQAPLMSDLPLERLAVNQKPFSCTGVDCFGPYTVKLSKKTRANAATAKRYGIIFTCLTTRAVHLDLLTDMSTDCFIMCLRRFKARRGHTKIIRCDNGGNFVGAERELREAFDKMDHRAIQDQLSRYLITWKFNPPVSPWMGGSWESLIKSTKRALNVITKDRLFTHEVLYTFLCEVESILNNRPITAVSDDVNDFEAITPNHILIGESSPNVFPGEVDPSSICLRKKWKVTQAAAEMFWQRWIREYAPSLSIRKKWRRDIRNLKVDDLVLLQSENIPRSHWPLGRIQRVMHGEDGVVRMVEVKTPNNVLIRPTSRVCLLEAAE